MQPVLTLLATGGTVETTTVAGTSAPRLGAQAMADFGDAVGVHIRPISLRQVPSWTLAPKEMAAIARAARAEARRPGIRGVVVTHGTTTLEYTAFLTDLLCADPLPIVFTGAMRRADDPDPDGPANVRDAITVAMDPAARRCGPLVVFAGRIIGAGRAWKADRVRPDAFVDLGGSVGHVSGKRVRVAGARPPRTQAFSGRLDTRVGYLKALPGMKGTVLQAAAVGVHGLIVEGLPGSGGVPPAVARALKNVAARMPVVIAPRSPFGRSAPRVLGGTGEPLAGLPLLSAGGLSAEQAWLLLMAALADGRDRAGAEQLFSTYVTETAERTPRRSSR